MTQSGRIELLKEGTEADPWLLRCTDGGCGAVAAANCSWFLGPHMEEPLKHAPFTSSTELCIKSVSLPISSSRFRGLQTKKKHGIGISVPLDL